MSGYSEDLRQRIILAVGRGMSKAQAARTFSMSLSSVKRYVGKAERGESLATKKGPGSAPKLDEKARELLEDDLRERPYLPRSSHAARRHSLRSFRCRSRFSPDDAENGRYCDGPRGRQALIRSRSGPGRLQSGTPRPTDRSLERHLRGPANG